MKYIKVILFVCAILFLIHKVSVHFFAPFPKGSVVVEPNGGLGNQMFQYAAAYNLAKETDSKLYVVVSRNKDNSDIMSVKNFPLNKFSKVIDSVIFIDEINNKLVFRGIRYNSLLNKIKSDDIKNILSSYLERLNKFLKTTFNMFEVTEVDFFDYFGKKNDQILHLRDNFESEIYFEKNKEDILKIFAINYLKNQDIINLISDVQATNNVCVHVRRGDMVNLPEFFMPIDYQKKAMKMIAKMIPNASFIVFTDSPEMVKKELDEDNISSFISGNFWHDFVAMSYCRNFIIGNSTFSWWAAYLNQYNQNIVIAPYPRVNKLFLEGIKDQEKRRVKIKVYGDFPYPNQWIKLDYNLIE